MYKVIFLLMFLFLSLSSEEFEFGGMIEVNFENNVSYFTFDNYFKEGQEINKLELINRENGESIELFYTFDEYVNKYRVFLDNVDFTSNQKYFIKFYTESASFTSSNFIRLKIREVNTRNLKTLHENIQEIEKKIVTLENLLNIYNQEYMTFYDVSNNKIIYESIELSRNTLYKSIKNRTNEIIFYIAY